jgi:hypothetical protein
VNLDTVLNALKEWRDARRAMFDYFRTPKSTSCPPEMCRRLADAEEVLMREAGRL